MVWALAALAMVVAGYLAEKSDWNDGVCRETGEYWRLTDFDSQGGRMYRSGDRVIWISWPVDTKMLR